jgi:hypothetical protein
VIPEQELRHGYPTFGHTLDGERGLGGKAAAASEHVGDGGLTDTDLLGEFVLR